MRCFLSYFFLHFLPLLVLVKHVVKHVWLHFSVLIENEFQKFGIYLSSLLTGIWGRASPSSPLVARTRDGPPKEPMGGRLGGGAAYPPPPLPAAVQGAGLREVPDSSGRMRRCGLGDVSCGLGPGMQP